MVLDKFLSEDERIIAELNNVFLTNDRVIELRKDRKNVDYTDIQLDKVDSFSHKKEFNHKLAALGGLSLFSTYFTERYMGFMGDYTWQIPITVGLGLIALAYLTTKRKYRIHSSGNQSIRLTGKSDVFDFWQSVNQEKNH